MIKWTSSAKYIISITSVHVGLSSRRFAFYTDGLLTVKRHKGVTPSPSTHPSRPSFETKKEMMKELLRQGGEPPQQHRQTKKNVSQVHALSAAIFLIQDHFQGSCPGQFSVHRIRKI
jgi:hypothetical protein